jgi:hypothetical protein
VEVLTRLFIVAAPKVFTRWMASWRRKVIRRIEGIVRVWRLALNVRVRALDIRAALGLVVLWWKAELVGDWRARMARLRFLRF